MVCLDGPEKDRLFQEANYSRIYFFLGAAFLAAGFLAAGFLAAGFLAAGFLAGVLGLAAFFAAGFLAFVAFAAGFLATFFAAGFLAAAFFGFSALAATGSLKDQAPFFQAAPPATSFLSADSFLSARVV